MDIQIDQIAGNIIVRPIKRLGRTIEFDCSVVEDLFLEPLLDEDVRYPEVGSCNF